MSTIETIQTIIETNPLQAFEYGIYSVLCGGPILFGVLAMVVRRIF